MKRIATFAVLVAPLAAHAVVASTSRLLPTAADAAWTGVGRMNGASAVAVGAHLVLTAGHVGAGDFLLGDVAYRMVSSEGAPKVGGKGVDLRLVTVAETLPSWYALGGSAKKGATVTMVGYGGTGVLNDSGRGYTLNGGGTQHAGTNKISSKEKTKGRGPTMRAMLDRAGESVLAPGDSGGGWFVGQSLVGISDFTFSKDPRKKDYGFGKKAYFGSGAVDLTDGTLRKWLNGRIAQDAAAPSFARARVQAVPEPAPAAALAFGALVLLRRRRRAA